MNEREIKNALKSIRSARTQAHHLLTTLEAADLAWPEQGAEERAEMRTTMTDLIERTNVVEKWLQDRLDEL